MMSPYNFDNLAALAKERQAEMLAQARQRRLLKEMMSARPPRRSMWQRLHHAVVDRLQHLYLHRPTVTRHSIQHH